MNNPTVNQSQFVAPFDILPNVIQTNPTVNQSQFAAPFDILPNVIQTNPTIAQSQFVAPFDLPNLKPASNPTIAQSQFAAPFDLPNSKVPSNPTANQSSFKSATANSPDLTVDQRKQLNDAQPNTNVTPNAINSSLLGRAGNVIGATLGIPQLSQASQQLVGQYANSTLSGTFTTLPFSRLSTKWIPGIKYADFRSRTTFATKQIGDDLEKSRVSEFLNTPNQTLAYLSSIRLDGTTAALGGSLKAIAYAAAAASPAGAYSVFNLDGFGKTGYGYGDHDNPFANRSDFTIQSQVASKWSKKLNIFKGKKKIGRFLNKGATFLLNSPAFRGDRVNVIDFGQRTLKEAYRWRPDAELKNKILGAISDTGDITQDFIKFFFTGPQLSNGSTSVDDIIVFRAHITALSDSFNANWNPVSMIGRADPNYHYTGYSRDLNLSFDIYATDRDELKPIYRKLNALAAFTSPIYNEESIAMEAPWMRLTIGDLFRQQPVVMSSLSYEYAFDAPWEINIEDDKEMMQVPLKISVQCQFNMITDYLPNKNGRFFSLAKRYSEQDAKPIAGSDNWLSDFDSITLPEKPRIDNVIYKSTNKTEPTDATFNLADELEKILAMKTN